MPRTIGIIHTFGAVCECHVAIERMCERFGFASWRLDSARLPDELPAADAVFEHASYFMGQEGWRWYPRRWAEKRGARVVGSSAAAVRLCDNKALVRCALACAGVSVPRGALVANIDELNAAMLHEHLGWPAVLKAVESHGSRYLAFVRTLDEAVAAAEEILGESGGPVLIEEHINGMELEVPLMPSWPHPLPLVEVNTADQVYTAELKHAPSHLRIVSLDSELEGIVRQTAERAQAVLGMRGYMRFDMRVRDRRVYVLDANVKPSLEPGYTMDLALCASGAGIEEGLHRLVASVV